MPPRGAAPGRAPERSYAVPKGAVAFADVADDSDLYADDDVTIGVGGLVAQPRLVRQETPPPPPLTAPPSLALRGFQPALEVPPPMVRSQAGGGDDGGGGGGGGAGGERSITEAKADSDVDEDGASDAGAGAGAAATPQRRVPQPPPPPKPLPRETGDGDDDAALVAPIYDASDEPVLDAAEARRIALKSIRVDKLRISAIERSVLALLNNEIIKLARVHKFALPLPQGMEISDSVRAIMYDRGFLPGRDRAGQALLMW